MGCAYQPHHKQMAHKAETGAMALCSPSALPELHPYNFEDQTHHPHHRTLTAQQAKAHTSEFGLSLVQSLVVIAIRLGQNVHSQLRSAVRRYTADIEIMQRHDTWQA